MRNIERVNILTIISSIHCHQVDRFSQIVTGLPREFLDLAASKDSRSWGLTISILVFPRVIGSCLSISHSLRSRRGSTVLEESAHVSKPIL